MADKKISQLPAATTPLDGTEEVVVVQGGTTKKTNTDAFVIQADIGSTVQAYDADTAKLDVAQTWTADQKFEGISTNVGANTPYSDAYFYLGASGDPTGLATNTAGVSGLILSQANWQEHMCMLRPADGGGGVPADSQAQMFVKAYNYGAGQYQWRKSMVWHYNGNVEVVNGNLIIGTSGKGIDFSADSHAAGMTSELLDDYEEGTWTPVLKGNSTDGDYSYSTQTGTYTKIGNRVYIDFKIQVSAINTAATGSFLVIDGLPYATANNNSQGSVYVANVDFSNGAAHLVIGPRSTVSQLVITEIIDNSGAANVSPADLTSTSFISGSLCYTVA